MEVEVRGVVHGGALTRVSEALVRGRRGAFEWTATQSRYALRTDGELVRGKRLFTPETRSCTGEAAGVRISCHSNGLHALVADRAFGARVTVVGDRAFAAAIEHDELDCRNAPLGRHEPITVPEDIERACVEHVRDLQLSNSALDFVVDHRLTWNHLEANVVGEFGGIERSTDLPISTEIGRLRPRPHHTAPRARMRNMDPLLAAALDALGVSEPPRPLSPDHATACRTTAWKIKTATEPGDVASLLHEARAVALPHHAGLTPMAVEHGEFAGVARSANSAR
ncbi:hypothetical protein OG948_59685 (plasmid) [Embleya sp. NBC_00888]|uniref:hypothetical protein n=1 Tax=Embleya sp. NBC_00888 TaxID=2975960 RepID=UPI002F90D456|nr:hypothetical protein OG948_59685 [Embleya sp. NBC_00888]